jgi:DNA-binding IclR family transcriptional regulator
VRQNSDERDDKNTHESLKKALNILVSFAPSNRERSATELGKELGLHRSTVSRLLRVLQAHGFIYQDHWTKKYSLGKSAFDVGNAVYQTVRERMTIIAQPYIDDLRDSIGRSVVLEVLIGNTCVHAYVSVGAIHLRSRFRLGNRLPAHIVAGGKAMLAFSPPGFVDGLLKEGLPKLTPNTITDPETLKRKLAGYRRTGLAFDLGESDLDYHFVAAPVFNFAKRPVAAVVTGDLAEKVREGFDPKMLAALKETAARISARLMYSDESETSRDVEEIPGQT